MWRNVVACQKVIIYTWMQTIKWQTDEAEQPAVGEGETMVIENVEWKIKNI